MRAVIFRRFASAGAAAFAVSVLHAASVAAATASYEDGVFRYRAQLGECGEAVGDSLAEHTSEAVGDSLAEHTSL
jgi:hypothetical protein